MRERTRSGGAIQAVHALAVMWVVCAGCAAPPEDTVREPGSDDRARVFEQQWLPRMMVDASEHFNQDSIARDFSRLVLDPSRLVLLEPTAVRIYFIASQGSYRNQLGYWLEGDEIRRGATVVFRDATSPRKLFEYAEGLSPHLQAGIDYGARRTDAPALPGDFVDLGILPAATQIVFFLNADGARHFRGRYTTLPDHNPDRLQHVVTIAYQDSPYLLLGFEDLMGGGDRSFNDVVFAVELSQSTIQALSDARKQQEVEAMLRARAEARATRNRILAAAAVALVLSAPLLTWLTAAYMKRRRIKRAYAAAQSALGNGDPKEALRQVREGLRRDAGGKLRGRWAEFEKEACKQLKDAAHLQDLFSHHPDAVLNDEAASLMVARAQLETDRTESFQTVLQTWRDQTVEPWSWLTLESDMLVKERKIADAQSLLQSKRFDGSLDAERLARLVELSSATDASAIDSAQSQELLARAMDLNPDDPEVHLSRARFLERQKQYPQADAAYRRAIECAPDNPFHRDHYAEYLVRRRNYRAALACWAEALVPPTANTVWLKGLFWDRVAGPAKIDWQALEAPTGPLQLLLELLRDMPEGVFWTPRMDRFSQQHPDWFSRIECFWLRVLQYLVERREESALALLAASPANERDYFDTMERCLRQVLTFRRVNFVNPQNVIIQADTPEAWAVPLFQRIDAMARGAGQPGPSGIEYAMAAPTMFFELFQAVAWTRAARIFNTAAPA